MRNSQEYSVAIHALLMLNNPEGRKITSADIAASAGYDESNVRKIFAKLRQAGLIQTKSGRGKTTLTRPAEEITLWDIYTAVEDVNVEKLFTFHHPVADADLVGAHFSELLRPHYQRTVDAMERELSAVTIASLCGELNAMAANKREDSGNHE